MRSKEPEFLDIPPQLSIHFLGDIHPGENYQEEREAAGRVNILKERGYASSFERVRAFVHSADYTIANLETPLTPQRDTPNSDKQYTHWSDPDETPGTLKELGVDAVCLANNHTMDLGHSGLADTLGALEKHGIAWFGAGMDEAEAYRPHVIEKQMSNGQKLEVAVLGAFAYNKNYDESYKFYARGSKSGAACIDEKLIKAVEKLRAEKPESYIVLFPHWGGNYRWKRSGEADWARKLVEAGADLIIGHGAHRFQEIESFRGRWILYNIGNFVMNSGGRYKKKKSTPYSFVARLEFGAHGDRIVKTLKLYPIHSDNRETDFKPHPLNDVRFGEFASLLREKSPPGIIDRFSKQGRDELGFYIQFQF